MQKLMESELRYRRLFEAAQDGVLILNAGTGMIEDVNPYLINMLGYSREEFIKKKVWEVGAFRDVQSSKDAFEALRENEYIRYDDLPLKAKNGKLIQVEFVSNVYQAGNEKVIQCNIRDITARKHVQDALQESEARYRRLFEAAQDGILILDAKTGMIEDVNPYLIKMLGYSREEFIKKKLWEVGAFKDIEANKDAFLDLQENEYVRYEDLPLKAKDGRLIQVEFVSNVYLVGGEKVIQCNIRDITARKQAEDAVQVSESKFRRLFEAAQDGILILDAKTGMIEDVNPYLIKMLGYSHAEFIKKKIWEVRAFEDIKSSKEAFEVLQENEYIRYEDLPLKAKDGRMIEVEFVSNVYKVGGEKVIQCNIRDITERKRAEEAKELAYSQLTNLYNNLPEAVFSIDVLQGRMLQASPAHEAIFGHLLDEFFTNARLWYEIVLPEDKPSVDAGISMLSNGKIMQLQYRILRPDGKIRWIEAVIKPSLNQDGKLARLDGIALDITERKHAEEDLLKAREFLQSVQDALSAHITILDYEGNIVQVNSAWRNFGEQNGLKHSGHCIGMNYLEVCDSANGADAVEAPLVANAIREVLAGENDGTWVEYPCHAPGEQRWFIARVTRFENKDQKWIVVSHENITERKQAEERIKRQLEHLTALSAIDRIIAANFDLKLSLSEILSHVTMELGIDAADILILNPNSQMLEYGAERGFHTEVIRKARVRLGESYAGRVALERQLVQIPNLRDETGKSFLASFITGENFVCYYGVPLISKGQVKGVLEIFHRTAFEPDAEWLDFLNTLAGQAAIAIENSTLFESLQRSNTDLFLAYDATIEGWSRALDLRDKETEGHTLRVTEMAVKLARAFGLSEEELVQVRWGALLHDIGKMGVPDGILLKPGPLTEDEWVAMKKHPTFAYEMLSPIRYLRLALDIPYSHHEKWDGTGYPHGLKGAQIPLVARIFSVVDVWDALSSDRPYRPAWTEEKVREHIRAEAGTYFDPQVVDVFMRMPN